MKTDISVIVPVYNVEQYLEECMNSLIAQTYKSMEFICINDGSTDSSLQILRSYEKRDSRIKVVDKQNEGYGRTLNRGVEMASSPWIGIVESDDFVESNMFEKLYQMAKDSDADIIKCNFYTYKAKEGREINYNWIYPKEFWGKEICPLNYPEIYNVHSSIWAGIYRKEFLDINHIRFNETPGASYQDIAFHFKVLSSAKKMKIVEDALLYYRMDNMNSSIYNPTKVFCVVDEMHAIDSYIREQSKERQEKLWPLYMRKKYYDYRWTYSRLAPEFQFALLHLMSKEFAVEEKEDKFEKVLWKDERDKEELQEIIKNPVSFFMRTKNKESTDKRLQIAGIVNQRIYLKGILQEIKESDHTVIYGAGIRGQWVAERLREKGISMSKLIFVVSNKGTENEVIGIPVMEVGQLSTISKNLFVIVAVKGEAKIEMLGKLQQLGIENVALADDEFRELILI